MIIQRTRFLENHTNPEFTSIEKRHRNVAHLWADKQVIRFFRHHFENKQHYKNLRSIYLALCEIDSDFGEDVEIRSFSKTVAAYAGMDIDTVYPYLKALQKADLIDYWQKNENGVFGQTILKMYKWEEDDTKYDKMIAVLGKTRARENPLTENTVHGKTRPINNVSKDTSNFKNSKESKNTSFPPDEKHLSIKDNPEHILYPFYQKAEYLSKIIQSNKNIHPHTTATLNAWSKDIKSLSKSFGIDLSRIHKALEWYENNVGGAYIPVIESGASFKEKFLRLEAAIERSKENKGRNGKRKFSESEESCTNPNNKTVYPKGRGL
jgi:hypothetical protein